MPKTNREEERYCPLCQKRETRSDCSYGEKVWDKVSVKDEEYSMARFELSSIENAVKRLKNVVGKGEGNLEAWVQSKITKAADYIDTAADYLQSGEMKESISDEPKLKPKSGLGGGKPVYPRGETPKATGAKLPKVKEEVDTRRAPRELLDRLNSSREGHMAQDGPNKPAYDAKQRLLKKAHEKRKSQHEENLVDKILGELQEGDPCWKGYTQVGMKKKGGKEVPNCVPSKGVPKAKGYKKESVTIQDANGNDYVEFVDLITPEPLKEATRLQAETGNIISVTLMWRGKYFMIRMFFPQAKLPSRKEIEYEIQKVYPDSKIVNHKVSDLKPGEPLIRVGGGDAGKFGPNRNYVKTMGEEVELDEEEEWQKKNRNDRTNGMGRDAVSSYRRSHPGSKLQTAVTEPNPTGSRKKRQKSFCSRSAGQRDMHHIDCSKTPDKPICKARSRWNCR